MNKRFLGVPSVIYNLHKCAAFKDAIIALNKLYSVMTNHPEEIKLFFKIGGLHLVLNYMRNDARLENICLKILVIAAKDDERIRKKLRKSDIFHQLSQQLKGNNFSSKNIILTATLIVILVLGNEEAQNRMRISGCLDSITHTLDLILINTNINPIPTRSIEIVTYAIATSFKDPQNIENQTQIGWILLKVLDFVSKQTLFVNVDQLHLLKCLWSFLRSVLDKNDINQKIFIKYPGAIVVFRCLQDILEDDNFEELEDLAAKITGVLVKLESQKEFLYQSFNYCSITILCGLLKSNNSLVIQNVITFLNSLTQEIPKALNVLKEIKGSSSHDEAFENDMCCSIRSLLDYSNNLQNYFCFLHDSDEESDSQNDSPDKEKLVEKQHGYLAHLKFHITQMEEKERMQQAIVKRNPNTVRNKVSFFRVFGKGVTTVFKKLWGLFFKQKSKCNCPWDDHCDIFNDQMFKYYKPIKN